MLDAAAAVEAAGVEVGLAESESDDESGAAARSSGSFTFPMKGWTFIAAERPLPVASGEEVDEDADSAAEELLGLSLAVGVASAPANLRVVEAEADSALTMMTTSVSPEGAPVAAAAAAGEAVLSAFAAEEEEEEEALEVEESAAERAGCVGKSDEALSAAEEALVGAEVALAVATCVTMDAPRSKSRPAALDFAFAEPVGLAVLSACETAAATESES